MGDQESKGGKPIVTMDAYAAPHLLQGHNARQAIRDAHDGKIAPLLGVFQGFGSVNVARWHAQAQYDMTWIDWEHTAVNIENLTTIIHETIYISGGKTIPFVRVPRHDHADIGYCLDAGASIIVPNVKTVEEAKHVVAAMRYGSKNSNGIRSFPPFRYFYGVADKPSKGEIVSESINDQAALMIQIESLEGINNLDAILTACPEIDLVHAGKFDMRANMSLQSPFLCASDEPEWKAAMETYDAALAKHNKPHCLLSFSPEMHAECVKHCALTIINADALKLMELKTEFDETKKVAARS